jgi:hypothetical protein
MLGPHVEVSFLPFDFHLACIRHSIELLFEIQIPSFSNPEVKVNDRRHTIPMSLSLRSEQTQLFQELGIMAAAADTTIQIQHTFLLPHSPRWEKITERAVDGWLVLGRHVVTALLPPLRWLLTAGSVYLVLYGTSLLVNSLSVNRRDDSNMRGVEEEELVPTDAFNSQNPTRS